MKKTLIAAGVASVIAVIGIISTISSYNGLVNSQEVVDEQWAQVENQMQRRADLIPNLVNTVKGFANQEKEIFTAVAEARNAYKNASNPSEKMNANNQLDVSVGRMLVLQEAYPELKSNQNFLQLSDELTGTENRIAVARQDYNKVVRTFNTEIKQFPTSMLANTFGFEKRVYFEAQEGVENVPTVNFGGTN